MSKFSFLQLFAISLSLANQEQYSESKVAGLAIGTVIGPIGQIDVIGVTPSNQATDFETNWESGDYIVSSIAIKTASLFTRAISLYFKIINLRHFSVI